MQVVVQGLSALTGVMLVRLLPKEDYGWFTIVGSMLATLSLLSDGGISMALTSVGGKIHSDLVRLGALLQTCVQWRNRLACVAVVVVSPFFAHLLARTGLSTMPILFVLALGALTNWPSTNLSLWNTAIRVQGKISAIQISEITGAVLRLLITGGVLLAGWKTMSGAMVATCVWAFSHMVVVGALSKDIRTAGRNTFDPSQKDVGGFVKNMYLNHVFACVQGQVATWIISAAAGSHEVADIGALGRLAVLFTVIGAPVNYLAMPAFARITQHRRLVAFFFMVWTLTALLIAAVIVCSAWRPHWLLFILGGKYSHLNAELPVALAGQGLTLLSTVSWGILFIRRWVVQAWVTIPLTVLGYVAGLFFCDLTTVHGLLWFSVASALPVFVVGVIWAVFKLLVFNHSADQAGADNPAGS